MTPRTPTLPPTEPAMWRNHLARTVEDLEAELYEKLSNVDLHRAVRQSATRIRGSSSTVPGSKGSKGSSKDSNSTECGSL
jgi:hypothetical protein